MTLGIGGALPFVLIAGELTGGSVVDALFSSDAIVAANSGFGSDSSIGAGR